MIFSKKKEVMSVKDFLACQPKKSHSHSSYTPLYGFMGLDFNSHKSGNTYDFNMPYLVVFGVAGVLILSTLIEYTVASNGNPRKAEMIESFTKLAMPIVFYGFLFYGIFKVFL
ncbi:hypothetical protein B4102_3308 [Heyndrickxia sporothermodurans]|uniref:Uncharacterized protein n=1 Tax=Heyndrickxia sporothermodurans TaxID=46224 RepID=A0A150KWH5_9BACI|nr:hypothetical protein [Heyndrickxia sporothermodurans]KYD04159.1 hypothetical protein B4102_3308 [Heyndrickxia sporothermodurans]